MTFEQEELAKPIEAPCDFRILRRLPIGPRKIIDSDTPPLGRALIVDLETTGLDPLGREGVPDEIIEFAALPISFSCDGQIIEIFPAFHRFLDSRRPIPSKITELTGITDAMVCQATIHESELTTLLANVDLVVAHHAGFDRPFCERLHPGFAELRWACSQTQVPWTNHGHAGTKLAYLLHDYGMFHKGHRGVADVFAVAELLSRSLKASDRSAFAHLLEGAFATSVRVYASGAPYEQKDRLRQRGYRWSSGDQGQLRAWYRDLPETDLGEELDWLYDNVLPDDGQPILRRIDGYDRFSSRV